MWTLSCGICHKTHNKSSFSKENCERCEVAKHKILVKQHSTLTLNWGILDDKKAYIFQATNTYKLAQLAMSYIDVSRKNYVLLLYFKGCFCYKFHYNAISQHFLDFFFRCLQQNNDVMKALMVAPCEKLKTYYKPIEHPKP
jgi:hypothetical protein